MNSIRQLGRRPVKNVLGVLLIALSSLALCLGVGQYWASAQTRAAIEAQYTTVAVATDKYKWSKYLDENGKVIGTVYLQGQPLEIQSFIKALPETAPECIRYVTANGMANGICAEITPISYANVFNLIDESEGMTPMDSPYNSAILAFELTKVGNTETGQQIVELTGTVTQVIALHPDYDDPTGYRLDIDLFVDDEKDLEALELQVGETYLLYSTNYSDLDRYLRESIASFSHYATGDDLLPEDISWDNITYPSKSELPLGSAALYSFPSGRGLYLTANELDLIASCSVFLFADPAHGYERTIVWGHGAVTEREMTEEEYIERYGKPGIELVTGDIQAHLENSALWRKALDAMEKDNHAFPILTTQSVEALAEFAAEKTYITEGRGFTEKEYSSGSPVCLISETLAAKNGLAVGDEITISFYEHDGDAPEMDGFQPANPSASYYSSYKGIAEEQTVTIVGLYRQTEEWSTYAFSFTPNTIIMPKNSVHCETRTAQDGVFSTIVLRNGTQDRLEELTAEAGWEGLFVYYDQGYSDIADSLGGYDRVGTAVLLIGLGVWMGTLLLFVLLFPTQMKRETVRMWALGTPRGLIFKHVFLSGGGLALVGTALAAIAGLFGMQWALERLTAAADTASTLSLAPWQTVLLCLLTLAAELCVLALCAARAAARVEGKEG